MPKRIIYLLLCLVLMLSLLTACGGETEATAEKAEVEVPYEAPHLDKKHYLVMDIERSISDNNLALLMENTPDVSAQREQIINSKTKIVKSDTFVQGETYTGTAYYVSNSGNDYNSGTSPDEAWASLDRVNSTKFSRGDAVFFERGGTWYGDIRPRADDMTFSAYGEGAKPIISGNEPEATNPERWREYGKTPDGGIVWVFENALTDSAQMLLGEDRQPAIRFCPDIKDGVFVNSVGREFDPLEMFMEDLSFFCDSDIIFVDVTGNLHDSPRMTDVYLRCDAGNPAEIFERIEFMYSLTGVCNECCGTVIDNLDIRNFGSLAVSGGMHRSNNSRPENYELAPSILVQNCELSYCGGCISTYNQNVNGRMTPAFSGGAIQLSGNGNRAINNYIHDVNDKVFIVAHHGNYEVQGQGYEGIKIHGNLLENCCKALHLQDLGYNTAGLEKPCYFVVDFTDNTVLYSGYGWFTDQSRQRGGYRDSFELSAVEIRGVPHERDDINISGNLFYGAEQLLVSRISGRSSGVARGLEYKEVNFSGNTYAQNGNLGRINEDVYYGTDLEKFVKEILGDETATIYKAN